MNDMDTQTIVHAASLNNIEVQSFGNLHNHDGGPVINKADFFSLRHNVKSIAADTFRQQAHYDKKIDGEWNYVGPAFSHFGHAMAESIHRIIPTLRNFSCRKWLLVGETGNSNQIPAVMKSVLSFFNVEMEDVKVLTDNSIVEKLNICRQGASFGGYVDSFYINTVDEFSRNQLGKLFRDTHRPKKLFISRLSIKHGGNILGEGYISKFFEANGFESFHPEDHDLPTQMDFYRKADVLVFSEGSACHGLELLSNLKDVFLLQRREDSGYIFDALIKPRSRHYERVPVSNFIGTAAIHPYEDRDLGEWGVSLLNIGIWSDWIKKILKIDTRDFREDEYYGCALKDLDDYISYHRRAGTRLVSEDRIESMRNLIFQSANFIV